MQNWRRTLLILSLILDGNSLYPSNPPPARVAVLELDHPYADPITTHRVADRIRDRLSRERGLSLLSHGETVEGLRSLRDAGLKGGEGLGPLLARARGHYARLEIDTAKRLLLRKFDEIRSFGLRPEESLSLVPATIFLGALFYDDPQTALGFFQEAVRLDPSGDLDEKEYPPRVRRLYERAKTVMLKRRSAGALLVRSSPRGAKIYLNGIYQGKTPKRIEGVLPGSHYVTFLKEGYEGHLSQVNLPTRGTTEVDVPLLKSDTGKPLPALFIPSPDRIDQILEKGLGAAHRLKLDYVVVVLTQKIEGISRVTVYRVDPAIPEVLAGKTVDLPDPRRGTGDAAREVVAYLNTSSFRSSD